MSLRQNLRRQLTDDEGKRKHVYKDHLGFYTIGIGRLVDARKHGSGLRDSEMEFMFSNDVDERIEALSKLIPWFQDLDDARQGVLLNMSFQMGVDGLLKFKKTLSLIGDGNYKAASMEMLNSAWAREQTPERAKRLSSQMCTGVWEFQS